MDGHDGEDAKQSTADMTVFVQDLLQQMFLLRRHELWSFLNLDALDDMGSRIDELEQSINDLRAEMGADSSPSPLPAEKVKPEGGSAEN